MANLNSTIKHKFTYSKHNQSIRMHAVNLAWSKMRSDYEGNLELLIHTACGQQHLVTKTNGSQWVLTDDPRSVPGLTPCKSCREAWKEIGHPTNRFEWVKALILLDARRKRLDYGRRR